MKTVKQKVFVAMSGGVDSSVAAALLKKSGFEVVGVFFKPWSPENGTVFCNWEEDRKDAMLAAARIGIEFKTWDFSKDYGKLVTKYMIDSYAKGLTPNPDIMCNKEIKFGLFLKKALAEGANFIATGHYARVKKTGRTESILYKLLKAKYQNKDQTYFLYNLNQKQLKYCLFPIGEYEKPEVRKLAKKFGLPNHAKKDSQGVCFVGQLNMKDFLTHYIKPKAGDIKLIDSNRVIGRHDGIYYYTIGQRHGLDIKNGQGPYFVAAKDLKKNIIYVADQVNNKRLTVNNCKITNQSWVIDDHKLPIKAMVKIRYRGESLPAVISAKGRSLFVEFKKPAKAVTPGQSVVIYRDQELLGGGVIVY